MGDYLKPGLVAEAYLHFFNVDFTPRLEESLTPFIREQAGEFARATFPFEFKISVEVGPGGVKIWIKVTVGTLVVIFLKYGEFRQSVDYAVHDSRLFAEHVIAPIVHKILSMHPTSVRFERRTGIPGMIKRIIDDLDNFHRHCLHASAEERHSYAGKIQSRTERVLELSDPQAHQIIATGLESVVHHAQPVLPPSQKELEEYLEWLRRRGKK